MKKFLAVLLTAVIFMSMFAVTSFAYKEIELPDVDYLYGFVYRIEDKAFVAPDEAVKELIETGETTIYLPSECEGKYLYYDTIDRYYGRQIGTYIPGSTFSFHTPNNTEEDSFYVHFLCSDNAHYDYENQIGTSELFDFLGYYDLSINKAVFLTQEEMDTLINTKELSLEDDDIRVFDEIRFIYQTANGSFPCGGSESVFNRLINKLEFSQLFNEGADEYRIVVNENASVFDDNCLFGMLKGIFRIIFENVFKFIIYS